MFGAGLAANLPPCQSVLADRAVLDMGGYHNRETGWQTACSHSFPLSKAGDMFYSLHNIFRSCLVFFCWWLISVEVGSPALTLHSECGPNQISCGVFPRKHGVLPELEINYHQGLSNQGSILKAVRVAIFDSAAVEDALITVHFSSVILMRLIHFAFFLWTRKSGREPRQTTSEWTEFITDWNAAWKSAAFYECGVVWVELFILMGGASL